MSYTLDKLVDDLLDHMDGKPSGKDVFVQVGDRYYLMRGQPIDRGGFTVLQAVEVQAPAALTEPQVSAQLGSQVAKAAAQLRAALPDPGKVQAAMVRAAAEFRRSLPSPKQVQAALAPLAAAARPRSPK